MSISEFQKIFSQVGKERDDALLPKMRALLAAGPRAHSELLQAIYSFPKEQQPKIFQMLAGISS